MRLRLRSRPATAIAATLLALCVAVAVFHHAIACAIVAEVAGAATGTRVSFSAMELTPSRLSLDGVRVLSKTGQPIATIARLEVRYNLRDLLLGSTRKYGLRSVEIVDPRLTIIRNADGTLNIPLPKASQGSGGGPPFVFTVLARSGSATLIDRTRIDPDARALTIAAVNVDAQLDTGASSRYTLSLAYVEDGRSYPIGAQGEIDVSRGFTSQHVWAQRIPVARLADYVSNNAGLRVLGGDLDGLDVRIFAFSPGTAMRLHVAGGVLLRDGTIDVSSLTAPIVGLHGSFDITDDAVSTQGVSGSIGSVGAVLTGGIYGLRRPHVHLALSSEASLADLRRIARAASSLPPLTGRLGVRIVVEGPASQPIAFLSLASPSVLYNGIELTGTRGLLAVSSHELDILAAQTTYGAIALHTIGSLAFTPPTSLRLLLSGEAPTASLPFAAAVAPGMNLNAAALATADDPRHLATDGVLRGSSATQRAWAVFRINANGAGEVGPLFIGNASRSLYARIMLDHPHARTLAVVSAQHFQIEPTARVPLGNFHISPIPAIAGTFDGIALGAQEHSAFLARIRGANFTAADGTPWLGGLGATVALRSGVLDVYDARASVAGGEAIASGMLGAHRTLSFSLAGASVRGIDISGAASIAFANGMIAIHDAFARTGPAIVVADGGVWTRGMRFRLDASVRGLDLHEAAHLTQPQIAQSVTGSADADLRIAGAASQPSVAAAIDVPEGSLYGEGFRDLRFRASGSAGGVVLEAGRVTLGSSPLLFAAMLSRERPTLNLHAPRLDLADLNDFFDTGDTFAGSGRLDVALALHHGLQTSGSAAFRSMHVRSFVFGETETRWSTGGAALHFSATSASAVGLLRLGGAVGLSNGDVDVVANARDVALASWLPGFGLSAPVIGKADAAATIRGSRRALDVTARGNVMDALAGRVPIHSVSFAGSMHAGRVTLQELELTMPYLTANATGSFEVRKNPSFDLDASVESPNVGALAGVVTGKSNTIEGALSARMLLSGTMLQPSLSSTFVLSSLSYAKLAVPRVTGTLVANRSRVALENGEAELARGRLFASASMPIHLRSAIGDVPISARLDATDIELSDFASLLPAGSQLGGRIDGTISVGGTIAAPATSGAMSLTGGSYSGPFDKDTLDGLTAELALNGSTLQLRSLRANAGGGSLTGSGRVVVRDLHDPANASFDFMLAADRVRVNSPQYFNGQIDGSVSADYSRTQPIAIGGNLTVSHARIPVSALYRPGPARSAAPPPNVAFKSVGIRIGSDVRIQNSSVDVGGEGSATLSGTLAAPLMAGTFRSTGGTLNFFQLFRIERASVTFDPSGGITPQIDAVAATSIANPPTDVRIHVTGPATAMKLDLSSSPTYTRSQILGLLVGLQSFGAVQGVPTSSTPFSATATVEHIGFGQANQVFTRSILQPISNAVGGALGVSNLQLYSNIGSGYGTGIGASLAKRIAQYVSMTTTANLGYPRQQMVEFRYTRINYSSLSLRLYQQQETFLNSTPLGLLPGPGGINAPLSSTMIGTSGSGFILSFERRYWSCEFWHLCTSCSGPHC